MLILGVVVKFGAFFASIPGPVLGGLFMVVFGMCLHDVLLPKSPSLVQYTICCLEVVVHSQAYTGHAFSCV